MDFLLEAFASQGDHPAIIWKDRSYSYRDLLQLFEAARAELRDSALRPGQVVTLEADFSPGAVALLLALIEVGCVIVPLTSSVEAKKPEFRAIAEAEVVIQQEDAERLALSVTGRTAEHPLYAVLKERDHAGLILYSSGSTGKSKAALHDFSHLLEKFRTRRQAKVTMAFLLFDHIGGINTMLHVLSNGGTLVTLQSRDPDDVCRAIEQHQVEILPTSPTFINLLLVSEAYKRHDLSSLELVTYGTEVMLENTLRRFSQILPHVRLQQTYGLSEVGILRSKSKANDSLWVKVGGEGFETRVVDGLLEIKAHSAMLGYLNAESPFTEDGWFKTGDLVERDGEFLLIKGRASEIINVGGQKVYPAEVENVLLQMENVSEVSVYGEKHPLTGQIVAARFTLTAPEELAAFRKRMRVFCQEKLERFMVPARIEIAADSQHGARFKKMRPRESAAT